MALERLQVSGPPQMDASVLAEAIRERLDDATADGRLPQISLPSPEACARPCWVLSRSAARRTRASRGAEACVLAAGLQCWGDAPKSHVAAAGNPNGASQRVPVDA